MSRTLLVTPELILQTVGPCKHDNPKPYTKLFQCYKCWRKAYRSLPVVQKRELAEGKKYYYADPVKTKAKKKRLYKKRRENPLLVNKDNERTRLDRKNNPGKYKFANIKRRYGITKEDYLKILSNQGGVCAICGGPPNGMGNGFHVDHDHSYCPGNKTCGKCVRGLICSKCNCGIGNLCDDINILSSAIKYLRRYSPRQTFIASSGI